MIAFGFGLRTKALISRKSKLSVVVELETKCFVILCIVVLKGIWAMVQKHQIYSYINSVSISSIAKRQMNAGSNSSYVTTLNC